MMQNLSKLALCALCTLLSSVVRADLIQQSTGYTRTVLMTSSADHISGATGLTLTVTESKSGGAFAASAGTVTEIGNGWYKIALGAGDTSTLGPLNLHVTAVGADPTDTADQVVAFNPNDAAALGLTNIGTLVSRVPNTLLFDGNGYVKSTLFAFNTGVQAPTGYLTNEYTNIANALLGSTVDSGSGRTITVKQSLLLSFLGTLGGFGTATRSTSAPWTITVPFLRLDGTTTGWTYVTTYTDGTFSKAVSRSFTVGALP